MARDYFGELNVKLGADDSGVKKGTDKAKKHISGFEATLKKAGTFIAGYFAVSAVTNFTRSILSVSDAMAKQARQLTMTVAEYDGLTEALQKGGMNATQAATAINYLAAKLGDLERGGRQAAQSFAMIGLKKEALAGKSMTDSLVLINEQLQTMNTRGKALAARELFGRGAGMRLGEGLNDAIKNIEEMKKVYADIGLGDKSFKDIENLNDQLLVTKRRLSLLGTAMISDTAPAIEKVAAAAAWVIVRLGKSARAMAAWRQSVRDSYNEASKGFGIFGGLIRLAGDVNEGWGLPFTAITSLFAPDYVLKISGVDQLKEIEEQAAAARQELKNMEEETRLDALAEKVIDAAKTDMQKFAETQADLLKLIDEGAISWDEYAKAIKDAHPDFQKAQKLTEKYADEIGKLDSQMQELDRLHSEGFIDEGTFQRGSAAIAESIDEITQRIRESEPDWQLAKELTEKYTDELAELDAEMQRIDRLFTEGKIDEGTFQRGSAAIAEGVDRIMQSMRDADPEWQRYYENINKAEEYAKEFANQTDVLKGRIDEMKALSAEGFLDSGVAERGMAALIEQINELDPAFVAMRDHMQALSDEAENVFQSTRTPFENMMQELGRLDELVLAGRLDWDTYGRAVDNALNQSGLMDMPERKDVAAGSTTAGGFASVLAASRMGGGVDKEAEQLEQQRQMRVLLEQIARNTETRMVAYG